MRVGAITECELEPLTPLAVVVKLGGNNHCLGYLSRECKSGDDLLCAIHYVAYMLVPGYRAVRCATSFIGPVAPPPQSSRGFAILIPCFLCVGSNVDDTESP